MNIDRHQKSYVCTCVFNKEKPVLLVSREDGDWCFLCGDEHIDDATSYRVVGIGHIIDDDKTIEDVLDLPTDWEAERADVKSDWVRYRIPDGNVQR